MPTTFVGLVLFVLLLAPGLTYRAYRAPNVPAQKVSALREVGGVALRSVLFDLAAIGAFGAVRATLPHRTPDVGALVRDRTGYLREHYVPVLWWSIATLAFACLLAVVAAKALGDRSADDAPRALKPFLPKGQVTTNSAWHVALTKHPEQAKYVGIMLNDGTYIDGYLWSYSTDSEETADREIMLTSPRLRESDADDLNDMAVGCVSVSARSIAFVTVTYIDKPPDPPPGQPPSGQPAPGP